MCAYQSFSFIHPEVFEGQAPKDSGLLTVKGVFYRIHEMECPRCGIHFQSRPLSDLLAAFGKRMRCELCKHEFIYRRVIN